MPVKGVETFVDAVTVFANRSIHAYVAHCVSARQQFMMQQDMQRQAGWTTATDRVFRIWLVKLDRIRKRMIHRRGNEDQQIEDLEARAIEMELELPAEHADTGIGDAIARPAGRAFPLRWKLDGTDPDVPRLSQLSMRNTDGFTLITALDLHICTATRLDSRHATHRITAEEGMMLYAGLLELWKVCDEAGGDEKIVGLNEGVLPSEEPQGVARAQSIVGGDEIAS